ncbi:MAG: GNAT family N-acetyltransferase [Bacteroidota bacterium]
MKKQIPYGIRTQRLLIRCYHPSDAPMLLEAITNSLDDLKKWMPWAQSEPSSLESKQELLKKFEQEYLENIDYTFGIFNKQENVIIGSTGLHTRIGADAREIGYWINSKYTNQGYATESTQALIKAGFEHHAVNTIEIHCDPENVVSLKIPKKLGFDLVDTLQNNTTSPEGEPRDTMIWRMTLEQYQKMQHTFPDVEVFYQ